MSDTTSTPATDRLVSVDPRTGRLVYARVVPEQIETMAPRAARELVEINRDLLGPTWGPTQDDYQDWLAGAGLPVNDERYWALYARAESLFVEAAR